MALQIMSDFLEHILTCNLLKLRSLINLGKDVNSQIRGTDGLTPLHIAVGIETSNGKELVLCLLEAGADPNAKSFDELTPVHIATMWNNCFNLEMLLESGGDMWLTDSKKKNSFDLALDNHAYEAFQLLNRRSSVEMLSSDQRTLICKNCSLFQNVGQRHNVAPDYKETTGLTNLFPCDNEQTGITSYLSANEYFPLLFSSTEDETDGFCSNVSSFFKKKNVCKKPEYSLHEIDSEVNIINDDTLKENKEKVFSNNYTNYDMSSDFLNNSSLKENTLPVNSSVETPERNEIFSDAPDQALNKGFISSDNEISGVSEMCDIISLTNIQNAETIVDRYADTGIVHVKMCSSSVGSRDLSKNHMCVFDTDTDSDCKTYQINQREILLTYCSSHSAQNITLPDELKKLSNSELYEELMQIGDNPGPVINCTRQTYLHRLAQLKCGCATVHTLPKPKYCPEIYLFLEGKLDMDRVEKLEQEISNEFENSALGQKWREGNQRCCFNYFLLDPRVTRNLPARADDLSFEEKFITFIDSVFYIGKGTRGRPYSHLFEATKAMTSSNQNNEKITHILDIWSSDVGVISLHCFNNSIPVEAYTREAAIIEAIGLSNLSNIKKGTFYGICARWTAARKRQLGISFLYRAFKIFLLEGERLIRPKDIQN